MSSHVLTDVKEDDYVECFIFSLPGDASSNENNITVVFDEVNKLMNLLCQGYIWHKDGLRLYLHSHEDQTLFAQDSNADLPTHIYGICHFGDNIEDEWFIVYLLMEITKKINGLAARVIDADGEFLLVEAANSLPSWVDPNNSENRVFLHKGLLHLIPPRNEDDVSQLTLKEGLMNIESDDKYCLASNDVQHALAQRVSDYPEKISETLHRTTVYTPVGVAALLKEDPSLISAAIHTFCNRDPIDLKACRAMKYFPPENRVNTSVTFTKCLYAMLMHNNYNPDRRTGWNLPLPNSSQFKAHSIGVKLACGLEILVSQAQPDQNLESNKSWKNYVQSLTDRKYFQDYLEGSNNYNELLEKAKAYFKINLESVNAGSQLGGKVLEMLGSIDKDEKEFRKNEALLPCDDDDKWLTVDPSDLENMLQERYGKKTFLPINGQTKPSMFSGKITDFLEHTSGIDGVEFPDKSTDGDESADLPVRPKRGIKLKKGVSFSGETKYRSPSPQRRNQIDFDADKFTSAIQNILDLVIPEDNWDMDSDSDLSEYGSSDELEPKINELASGEMKSESESMMKKYMAEMDNELSQTVLGKSFEKCSIDNDQVDVDVNALKNILESYKSENGGVGPAGSILGPLGFTKHENIIAIDDDVD